jgi:hypothetical protein
MKQSMCQKQRDFCMLASYCELAPEIRIDRDCWRIHYCYSRDISARSDRLQPPGGLR